MQTDAPEQWLSRKETSFVRFLAIVLITNSHLHHLYPISQMGTGGAIGNALFFTLSGYGLAVSDRHQRRSFPVWYRRRFMRIYPSLFLVSLADFMLNRSWFTWRTTDYITALVWPTQFWFIGAIMIFYPLFFVVLRYDDRRAFICGIALLSVVYMGWYVFFVDLSTYTIEGPHYFKWIFYLLMMFFGGYLATPPICIPQGTAKHLLLLLSALLAYLGVILVIGAGFGKVQALIHVLTIPIVYLLLTLSKSTFVLRNVLMRKIGFFLVCLVAGLTLEIYLLQSMVYSSPVVIALPFPANIGVFWCIVVLLALLVSKGSFVVRQLFRKDEGRTVPTY
jgi:peptidoglycan/LPS O-acetylase OafA/YrhL